jgi:hypothetical protein
MLSPNLGFFKRRHTLKTPKETKIFDFYCVCSKDFVPTSKKRKV